MKSLNQRRSQRQEKAMAQDVGGRTQPGSGSQDFAKGDVRKVGEFRGECKTTVAASTTLHLKDLLKIQNEALMGGLEDWALQLEFIGQGGRSRKYAVIDWETYVQLRDGV